MTAMAPISRNSPWEGAWRQRLPATYDDLPHSEGPSTIVADDANQPSISHSGPADWQYPQTYCHARYGDGHRLTAVAFAAAASASASAFAVYGMVAAVRCSAESSVGTYRLRPGRCRHPTLLGYGAGNRG